MPYCRTVSEASVWRRFSLGRRIIDEGKIVNEEGSLYQREANDDIFDLCLIDGSSKGRQWYAQGIQHNLRCDTCRAARWVVEYLFQRSSCGIHISRRHEVGIAKSDIDMRRCFEKLVHGIGLELTKEGEKASGFAPADADCCRHRCGVTERSVRAEGFVLAFPEAMKEGSGSQTPGTGALCLQGRRVHAISTRVHRATIQNFPGELVDDYL
jgi:hypothetical protein